MVKCGVLRGSYKFSCLGSKHCVLVAEKDAAEFVDITTQILAWIVNASKNDLGFNCGIV